ncbi:glycosyltransferase family 4 protein [Pedobacter sp. GSP4]|uniref:glycosyltransferase family 4 protein n=1 Tax=Pedobacter sp. GSP4 TaxID=3453716 RepID=UPI003EEA9B7B
MNLLVDARWSGDTGIGRVFKEVMKRMPEGVTVRNIKSSISLGHPFSPITLGMELLKAGNIDQFYSPSYMPPVHSSSPFIITIHDLNHLYYYSYFHKIYLKYIIAFMAKNAKAIITVSKFSKYEIVNKLGIPKEKVKVVYNGVDDIFLSNNEALNLGFPYFLYVGNRRSYKNLEFMITAFAAAVISNEFKFVISGQPDEELLKLISRLNIQDRIYFYGFIPEDELPKLYKGAHGLLFLSLMEGFGLPVLEAMASSTPVITSNTTSLQEIGCDAAILVDPSNLKDVVKEIENLANDKCNYSELVEKGLLRAKEFSWEKTGRETWDIILG